ncbi:ATP-binding protein [Saccharopolyspora sp. NPDC000995]
MSLNGSADRVAAAPPDPPHWHEVPAEPGRLRPICRALTDWASGNGVTDERAEAVALAAYEAMANVVTHAYPDGGGVLSVRAAFHLDSARIEIAVQDYGRWRIRAEPEDSGEHGGRGLVLIRSLADHVEVLPEQVGTTVRMTWDAAEPAEPQPHLNA